jgi:hypothetical protein
VALVVGTVLAMINHGPSLIALELSNGQLFQIGLTYLVPYGVSTYSSVKMLLRKDGPHPNKPMVEQAPHRHPPPNSGPDQ